MVKGFNEAWRNSARKESEISIRYQYKSSPSTLVPAVKFTQNKTRFPAKGNLVFRVSKKSLFSLDESGDFGMKMGKK